jgi:hypothetical protein
MVINNYVAG